MTSQVSPDTAPVQLIQLPQIIVKHERKSCIASSSNIPTPVSMSGPPSPLLPPTPGVGSHTATSPRTHSRNISEDRSSRDGDENGKLRTNISSYRDEEPPRNQEGKMTCRHHECSSLFFDRKCDWNKHMDKHDRPYKCNAKGCEKLQGFTYTGGLLRHEREVHKMHGGTKSLFCPVFECKRSSCAGFMRKENLAEHIRRVHRDDDELLGLKRKRESDSATTQCDSENLKGGGKASASRNRGARLKVTTARTGRPGASASNSEVAVLPYSALTMLPT